MASSLVSYYINRAFEVPLAASISGLYSYLSAPRQPSSHLQPSLYASVSLSHRLCRLLILSAKLTLKIFSVCRSSESITEHTYVRYGAFRATEHTYDAFLSLSVPLWRELIEWTVKFYRLSEKNAHKLSGGFTGHTTFSQRYRSTLTGCQRACSRSLYKLTFK